MTTKEVAEVLAVSESMVLKLRRQGLLPCKQIGTLYRFRREDVAAFVRAR